MKYKSKCCGVNESAFGTCANCGLPFEPVSTPPKPSEGKECKHGIKISKEYGCLACYNESNNITTPSSEQSEKGWEEEFDKKFGGVLPIGQHKCEGWNDDDSLEMDTGHYDFAEVKSFIRQVEQKARKEAKEQERERVVKIIKDKKEMYEPAYEPEDKAIVSFGDDIINLIKE